METISFIMNIFTQLETACSQTIFYGSFTLWQFIIGILFISIGIKTIFGIFGASANRYGDNNRKHYSNHNQNIKHQKETGEH